MLHELKIFNSYYESILKGLKTFEIRKNDRDFKVGDLIKFIVLTDKTMYVQRESDKVFEIIYLLKDIPEFGLQNGYCVMSIKERSYLNEL